MIRTKGALRRYIKADFDAQEMQHPWAARFTYGENWAMFQYMKTLRKLEYYKNTPPHYIWESPVCLLFIETSA